MPTEPLLTCPFCGGEPEVGHVNEDEWGAALDEIRCVSCQVGGLRAGWQRRAGLSPIARTEIERIRNEMARATMPTGAPGSWVENPYIEIDKVFDWTRALDSVLGAESTKEGT